MYGCLDQWLFARGDFVLIMEVLDDDEEKQRAIAKHHDTIWPANTQQRKLKQQSLTLAMKFFGSTP